MITFFNLHKIGLLREQDSGTTSAAKTFPGMAALAKSSSFKNLRKKLNLVGGRVFFYRGSYMSAHVLLNLFNELGKRDKMQGLPSIYLFFRNEFNKFNKT